MVSPSMEKKQLSCSRYWKRYLKGDGESLYGEEAALLQQVGPGNRHRQVLQEQQQAQRIGKLGSTTFYQES